jgi:peptidoglycan/LPS O-acetylase OafA/YrhL
MVSAHPASVAAHWRDAAPSGVQARQRDGVIDTMRGVAIVMVIAIHSLPKIEGSALVTAIDAVLRPCVPLFLFASGYLTAQARDVPLARRIKRALGPYTIAFIAAYLFMALQNPAMDHRPFVIVARYGLAYVFVYYYVFVYVGCTVMLWLAFAAAGPVDDGRRARLLLVLALAICVGFVFGAYLDPLLQRLGASNSLIEEARMRDLPFWFGFVALGVIVGNAGAPQTLRDLRYPLAAATMLAYAAYAAIRIAGIGDAADYDSIAFFLYAALLCLTMLGFAFDWQALAVLGVGSYFIYLWHIFPIMLLRQWPGLQQQAATSFAVKFAVALATSALLVVAIRRARAPRLAQWLGA